MTRILLTLVLCSGFSSLLIAQELDYHVTDPDLKVVRLDSSPDDSFLSVRVDPEGRIFVGGRKTLHVYDLDAAGRSLPRRLLFEFPDHSWVNDIEFRGDDLYVVTVSAVYRLPEARVKRDGITIERLLWGVPNGHVHQCFHACAWGPEGDLYVSMGDPLWYYGDFNRPDHWGHWTMYYRPSADGSPSPASTLKTTDRKVQVADKKWATMTYNGVGAVFRIRPDGTGLQSHSRGLRNPCGLCFDKDWNLFTNDNDHEGMPALYAPGRLLHVTAGSYFSWPRGWLTSKTPDRADILPAVNEQMGRAVPVLQTYYSDGYLPARYDNSLFVARWCRRQVTYFPLVAAGGTFTAQEHVLLEGRDQARPVGVCVGRGGRVFVTICYMAQNEGSPTYRSDLAVITRKDDPETMPFESCNLVASTVAKLQDEQKQTSVHRRQAAWQELLRREGRRAPSSPLASTSNDSLRETEFRRLAVGGDPMQRQANCFAFGYHASPAMLAKFCRDPDPKVRMSGVIAAGFGLTVPPVDAGLPDGAPLTPQQKEEANIIQFADEKDPVDLRRFGRVGNYTTAEHWNALKHSEAQEQLFSLLMERLEDGDDKVRLEAAHFLSLLNDTRSEPKIASVTTNVQERRLNLAKLEHLKPIIWTLGPVPDKDGFRTVHPIETAAIDLGGKYEIQNRIYEWRQTKPSSPDRPLYDFHTLFGVSPQSSVYSFFRFEAPTAQRMQLLVGSEDGVKIWQNGKLVFENDVVRPLIQLDDVVPLDLQPGSNDVLVRVSMRKGLGGQYFHYRHLGDVRLAIPEKPDGLSLAERLKSASHGTQAIDPRFLDVDWQTAVKSGNAERGQKLFAAESLGCAKCHAATSTQAGGGGPSLADSGKRFTIPYLVESVLAPNKIISPVFKSSILELGNGKVIAGLIVSETAEQLEVLQADTKRVTVRKTEIESRKLADVSAMPVGLVKQPDELRDVIAYLLSNP